MAERKKIAVILSRFPYPLDKGDKLRAFHQIKYLSQFHDLYLFCLSTVHVTESDRLMLAPFCKGISIYPLSRIDITKGILFSFVKNYPVQVGYFFSKRIKSKIKNEIRILDIDVVYCQLSRTALYAKDLATKKIIDFQDAFSVNYQRIAEQSSGIEKMFYKREASRMKVFEQNMLQWFSSCTIISEFDKQQVSASGKLTVIPNGVDTQFFTPTDCEKKYDLLFVGNHSYLPNRNAVLYLYHKILPLLLKSNADIRIHIVGADTPKEIMALNSKNFVVSGFVPDIRDAYNEAFILIAPLFMGAGLQNKLLEAMSMKLPCITTALVNSSLGATTETELLIAEHEQDFAARAIELLSSESRRQTIGKAARKFVMEKYGWDSANEKLLNLI